MPLPRKTTSSSTPCPLTSIFPLFSPLCTPTVCKDCHHMFHRGILQHVWLQGLCLRYMLGLSLGSPTVATPTARYFTFTSTWHQAHIARGSLLSVSSHHPSTPHSPSLIQVFHPQTFSPETSISMSQLKERKQSWGKLELQLIQWHLFHNYSCDERGLVVTISGYSIIQMFMDTV